MQDRGSYDYKHHCEVDSDNADFVSDEVVDRFCLLGPPRRITRNCDELEEVGVTQFNIYLMCGDEEQNAGESIARGPARHSSKRLDVVKGALDRSTLAE